MHTGHDGQVPILRVAGERRCEFELSLRGQYCAEMGAARLDGLLLCPGHDDRLRLEEQAACWEALLLHADLWSEAARQQGRGDLAQSLAVERAKIVEVLGRVRHSLEQILS